MYEEEGILQQNLVRYRHDLYEVPLDTEVVRVLLLYRGWSQPAILPRREVYVTQEAL